MPPDAAEGSDLRLVASASIDCDENGVVLHSEFGDLVLPGADMSRMVEAMLPNLRTGLERASVRTRVELPASGADRQVAATLMDLLERHGVVGRGDGPLEAQRRAFVYCGESEAQARLQAARILAVGSATWMHHAVSQLARSGVSVVHLVGDDGTTADVLAEAVPDCKVTTSDDDLGEGWSIVLNGLPALAVEQQRTLARYVATGRYSALAASGNGLEATIGPVVVAGRSPCWDCCRHRLLANVADPWATQRVHRRAGEERARGPDALPSIANGLIGHAVAQMALRLIAFTDSDDLHGQLVVQNLLTLATTHHRVVPLPWCDVCGGAEHADISPIDWSALASASDRAVLAHVAPGWVDDRTGITPAIHIRAPSPVADALPVTAHGHLSAFSDARASSRYLRPYAGAIESFGGKGTRVGHALLGALAEGMERYAASRIPPAGIRRARIDALDGNVLDPRRMALYDEEQYRRKDFPFVRFDPAADYDWVAGRWADTAAPVWTPARLAYYGELDAPYAQVTSSGLAAGQGYADAGLRAILELVERDAFMVTWLCRRPARRLILDDAFMRELGPVVQGLEAMGAEVRFYLLDVGLGPPVILCTACGDGQTWPGLTIALGAHLGVRGALRAALLEQAYSGPYIREVMLSGSRPVPETPADVTTFLDHALFYVPPGRAAACAFLDEGQLPAMAIADWPAMEYSAEPDATARLASCAAGLRDRGVRAVLVDVTSPDVATTGLRVVRAMAEGAQPLHCGHGLERSANTRLDGFRAGALNREVHPMC